jgi:hypothetical protein
LPIGLPRAGFPAGLSADLDAAPRPVVQPSAERVRVGFPAAGRGFATVAGRLGVAAVPLDGVFRGADAPFEGIRPRVPRESFAAMGLIHYTASAK